MLVDMLRASTFFVLLFVAACSAPVPPPAPPSPPTAKPPAPTTPPTTTPPTITPPATTPPATTMTKAMTTPFHARFAIAAKRYLEAGSLKNRRGRRSMNCTGLVQACFDTLGCDDRPKGSTRALHKWCVSEDRMVESPEAGDLVFFDDTWDKNRDGRLNDPLTHVGIVTATNPDGRVRFVHVGSRKLKAGVLDSGRPGDKRDRDGNTLNSPLRVRRRRDPRGTAYLAGQLLRGYCRPIPCGDGAPTPPGTPRSAQE